MVKYLINVSSNDIFYTDISTDLIQYEYFRLQEAWSLAESRGIERKTTLQKLEDATLLYNTLHAAERNCYSEETEFNPLPSLDIEWITMKITEVSNLTPSCNE